MDVGTARFLARYNGHANRLMNEELRALSAEEWEKDLGGYFPSIRSLCSHVYVGDFNWLKRFSTLRSFAYRATPLFDGSLSFAELAVGGFGDYEAKRAEMDGFITSFCAELAEDDLGRKLKYVDSHGAAHERDFGYLVLHQFNHQTHHRGMVSLYLEQLGRPNDFSNMMVLA